MSSSQTPSNVLKHESSPYLLQHKDHPIHWQPWGRAAFERARIENKPILLSLGYASCHWCHVMAHESFETDDIANLVNALFINVKVDREERPEIDAVYQSALALMGERGGWPLTMFLTPEGEPFWGGTYFPPIPTDGRPSLSQALLAAADAFQRSPHKVKGNASALRQSLAKIYDPHPGAGIAPGLLDFLSERLLRDVDPLDGGLRGEPKFPQTTVFEMIWRAWRRTRRHACKTAVITTLDRMCQGGIYDHLGGGFARYSTDSEWLVPHFEKMLCDNAQIVDLMTQVWRETQSPLYAQRIEETIDWVLREMRVTVDDAPGGFAGSLDADSNGEEGGFYLWTEAEIDRLLGAEAAFFKQAYDVSATSHVDEKNILNRRNRPELGDAHDERRLANARAILLQSREQRIRPGRDDKVLADWNGLMIAALAHAASAFQRPEWLAAAKDAFTFIGSYMTVSGRLRHSWRLGRLGATPALLDDYAHMCNAGLALVDATGDRDILSLVRQWIDHLDQRYWDNSKGGYYLTANDAEPMIVRVKHAHDAPTPSGNGVMVNVLARMAKITGEQSFRDRAEAIVRLFSGEVAKGFIALPTLLNGADALQTER
ncbi:Thioredoxin domain-containing protein [Azospirillaceae bacterium]